MSVTLLKKIAHGFEGTIYLAKYQNKKCIYKIQKKSDAEIFDPKSDYNRQIEFNAIAEKYPKHFMQLEQYGVITKCKHDQPIPDIEPKTKKIFIELNKNKKCVFFLYDTVYDGTLMQEFQSNKMFGTPSSYTKQQIRNYLDMIRQIMESINILKLHDYTHGDIHPGNVMYKKEKGYYRWNLVDFGAMYHNKKHAFMRKKYWLAHNDVIAFISILLIDPLMNNLRDKKLKIKSDNEIVKRLKKTPEYEMVKKYLPKKDITQATIALMKIFHYDQFIKAHGYNPIDRKNKKFIPPKTAFCELFGLIIKHSSDDDCKVILALLKKEIKKYAAN